MALSRTLARRVSARRTGVLALVEDRVGVTAAGLGVAAAAVAGWFLARAIGGRTLYLMVYSGALMLGVAVGIARRARPISAQRSQPPSRSREGQVVRVEVTLEAKRHLSSFVVEEKLHPLLGAAVRIPVSSIAPGQPITHSYSLTPRLRGVYKVGPLVAEWSDPFGLALGTQALVKAVDLIAHPSTELVLDRPLARQWEDPPMRPPVTKPWPAGFEFYGMRDYIPGDDLRRVVWRAVARTGRMLVREYEQGITDRVVILVDTDTEWHRPGEPSDTFESVVRVAASVGARHLRDGFSVTLESNGRQLANMLRGPQARIALLDQLAMIKRDRAPLARGIDRLLQASRNRAHHVVVTPHLTPSTAARLRFLIDAGGSVLVVAVLWDESDPLTLQHAAGIGAQVVEVRPGAALRGAFEAALRGGLR
ncbi:MAG: DUF58 domain-containing protein [Candidatus Dormibacteria bacterium]